MTEKYVQLPFAPDTHVSFVSGFALEAGQFDARIEVLYGERTLNAKSILSMMCAGIAPNAPFLLRAEGADEQEAVDRLTAYLTQYQ